MRQKRGRKGFGGIRVIVHLSKDILDALAEHRKEEEGVTRAELIRRALAAMYLGKRRSSDWKTSRS